MSSPPRPTAITDSAFNCFDDLHLEDQEENLNPFAESSSPQHHPGQKSFKIGTRGRSGGLTMEDALGPFRRGIEEDNQFFDMDMDDPFKVSAALFGPSRVWARRGLQGRGGEGGEGGAEERRKLS